jgi:hypothetical protein
MNSQEATDQLSSQDAAIKLKDADSPDEVEEILESGFFNNAEWMALGGMENNYGVVENQAGAPVPALMELIVNSYDAQLMKGFHELAGTTDPDPETDDLPEFESQAEAREELLDQGEDKVTLRADGFKPSEKEIINFTVIDNGCGQPPERFEDTFLGLLDPGKYKQDYPFLQGQYGMGSAAVLQFCKYKFICSAAASDSGDWSWSIIRQNKDRDRYEYLTIGGEVPTFEGSIENKVYGSFVKAYDYRLNVTKTTIAGDKRFQKRLERFLVDPPLPLNLHDTRYSDGFAERQTGGLRSRIHQYEELLEESYSTTYNFDNERLGIREIEVFTFKDNDEIEKLLEEDQITVRNKNRFVGGGEHRDMAVLYTVNGQTHGNEGQSFLTNRCKKPRVGTDTLVLVDCSDLAGTDMVDLFQPTRDRVKRSEIGNSLREGTKNAIEEDEWLIEEEERRRKRLASDESDEILDESLQSILEEDPDLQRFFESGDKATADVPAEEEAPYNPPQFPDTFEIIETYDPSGDHEFHDLEEDGQFSLEVPVNRTRQVRFYLNAPNDYLTDDGQGELRIRPTTDAVKWSNLNRGVLTLGITAPTDYNKGDVITLILNITRPDDNPLSQRVKVEFAGEQETTTTEGGDPPEPTGSAGLSLPKINRVKQEDWSDHEFDEHDIVRIATAGDSISDMDIYVNIHAAAIRRFLQNRNLRESGKKFVQERYVVSVALYSVAMYVEFREKYENDDMMEFGSPEELVASSMRGMGQVLLHSIAPKQLLSEY